MARKSNKSKALTPTTPTQADTPVDREDLLIRNLFVSKSVTEAAIAAGYSPKYAKGGIYDKIKDSRFQEKLKRATLKNLNAELPKVARHYSSVMKHLNTKDGIKDAAKLKHVPKQILQIGGLLQHDGLVQQNVVEISDNRQLLSIHFAESKDMVPDKDSPNIIEVTTKPSEKAMSRRGVNTTVSDEHIEGL